MNELLTDYAIKNVWCDPTRDHQQAFHAIRLGNPRGEMVVTNIHRDTVRLPDSSSRWMVYQVGGVSANRINIPTVKWEWFRVDQLCEQRQMLIDVYTENGVQLNKSETYIFWSRGGALFIAIKLNPFYTNFETTEVYIRFYTGRGLVDKNETSQSKVRVFSEQIEDTTHVSLIKQTIDTLKANHDGAVFTYVNGRYVDEVSLRYIRRNDYVEVYFDPSVYKTVDIQVSELRVFLSELDSERKYLVHPPKDDHQWIDYVDDIDVYLIKKINNRCAGVYYHHSTASWMRQVTHRDYSIPVNKLRSFYENYAPDKTHTDFDEYPEQQWGHLEELTLRLFFRRPAFERPLVKTALRLHDLYRFNDIDIVKILAGIDGNIPFWTASYLEKCDYVNFMKLDPDDLYPEMYGIPSETSAGKEALQEMVGRIFGYHSATKLLADTPTKIKSVGGVPYAPLSFEYWYDTTVYEYDAEGILLGAYHSGEADMYRAHNDNAALVETMTGRPGNNCSRSDKQTSYEVGYGYNVRLFVCTVRRSEPQNDWLDITNSPDQSKYGQWESLGKGRRKWTWSIDNRYMLGIIATDQFFIHNEITLDSAGGILTFSLSDPSLNNGEKSVLPLRELDVWLNGRALQPNLDYTVQWPRVVLHCADYLIQDSDEQKVVYRAYGMPDSNFDTSRDTELGFVQHDVLSRDGITSFYDERVYRIVVDGRVVHRDQVVFDEESGQFSISHVRNGAPYSVKCGVQTLYDVFPDDQTAKDEDDKRNKLVSDFLTMRIPSRQYPEVDLIGYRYNVISCFANKILHDLIRGIHIPEWIEGHYSERDIEEWYENYTWMLSFDIAQRDDIDTQRVKVIPHWRNEAVVLPFYRYVLFQRIVKHYLNITLDTSLYIKVEEVEKLP